MFRQTDPYRIEALQGGIRKALSILRNPAYGLISPQTVVLEGGSLAKPLVHQRLVSHGSVEDQFLAAVSEWLQLVDEGDAHGRRVNVLVSDFWARPLVLPFPGKTPTDAEVDTILASNYRRIYADMMQGWAWSWALQEAQLVCVAWPSLGLAALRDGISQRAGLLTSAKPIAVEMAGAVLGQQETTWIAIIEHQTLSLLRLNKGVWEDYLVIHSEADIAKTLVLQLTREVARRQDPCHKVFVVNLCGAAHLNTATRELTEQGWTVSNCPSEKANTSWSYRLTQSAIQGTVQ